MQIMNSTSIFKIKIDFEKSKGAYLFDKTTQKKYVDFMSMYATLPLGYNHEIFSTPLFKEEILRTSNVKITNCEMLSDESEEFNKEFISFAGKQYFTHFHYCCTGALGIEAAIKTAIDYTGFQSPKVISFKGSFHGINSYGGFVTDRFPPVSTRLDGFPGGEWPIIDNPIITYRDNKPIEDLDKVQSVFNEIESVIQEDGQVCCILIEPIQCTFGDRYFPMSFFTGVRRIADKYNIPLIFDEIQVGFGSTGKLWYYEHTGIIPDILVFGKKTQLSGIMVKDKFAKIFKTPTRLEVTWDADLIDMIRCKYVMKAMQQYDVIKNVQARSEELYSGLHGLKNICNLRNQGLLFAFDFDSRSNRDKFMESLVKNGLICNPTKDLTIRLRPNLFVNKEEVNHALNILELADQSIHSL